MGTLHRMPGGYAGWCVMRQAKQRDRYRVVLICGEGLVYALPHYPGYNDRGLTYCQDEARLTGMADQACVGDQADTIRLSVGPWRRWS